MNATEQRFAALEIANHVRTSNGEWKRSLSDLDTPGACTRLADVLEDRATMRSHIGSIKVAHALMAIRRIGPGMADRMLMRAGVRNGHRQLRDLAPEQRRNLVTELRIRATRPSEDQAA